MNVASAKTAGLDGMGHGAWGTEANMYRPINQWGLWEYAIGEYGNDGIL